MPLKITSKGYCDFCGGEMEILKKGSHMKIEFFNSARYHDSKWFCSNQCKKDFINTLVDKGCLTGIEVMEDKYGVDEKE